MYTFLSIYINMTKSFSHYYSVHFYLNDLIFTIEVHNKCDGLSFIKEAKDLDVHLPRAL